MMGAEHICTFCRLTQFDTYEKECGFVDSLINYQSNGNDAIWYFVSLSDLAQVPGTTYAYWASPTLRALFNKYPPLDRDVADKPDAPKITDVKLGLSTADYNRFIRRFWEVKPDSIGQDKKWMAFAKGDEHTKFYANIDLIVNWENQGEELKNSPHAVIRNESFYFHEGLTYSRISVKSIGVHRLPANCIFEANGPGIFINTQKISYFSLMALLESELMWVSRIILSPTRSGVPGVVAALPIAINNLLPDLLHSDSIESYSLLREWDTGNEISTIFIKPWILQVLNEFDPGERPMTGHPFTKEFEWSNWNPLQTIRSICGSKDMSLRELAELCIQRQNLMDQRLRELQKEIDEEAYRLYEISDEDRQLIERELALRRGETLIVNHDEDEEAEVEDESDKESSQVDADEQIRDHVIRLISYYIKLSIESDDDGIVPLDTMFDDNLLSKVRAHIATDFGDDRISKIEREISEILGKSLVSWIEKDYFTFHVSLYKRRPIFWRIVLYRHGRSNAPGAFSCFVHYHKLTRDTIPKIQAFYLSKLKERAGYEKDRILRERESARSEGDTRRASRLSKEYEKAANKVDELQKFEEMLMQVHSPQSQRTKLGQNAKWVERTIAEVRDNGYNPILDHGVRVNIEPLKEAKLLPPVSERIK